MNTETTLTTGTAAAEPQAATLLTAMDADLVAEAIKAAGCAVTAIEQDGAVRLHSASHGIGYQVLWGNAVAAGRYADLTLSCPLRVQGGALPEGLLSEWHRTKRFARVAQHGDFVVLEMDVIVAGGVGPAYLPLALQIWTQMMGQFFVYLRNYKAEHPAAAGETAAETA